MKLVKYEVNQRLELGVLVDREIFSLEQAIVPGEGIHYTDTVCRCPVSPAKIICITNNFEKGNPERIEFFIKPSTTLITDLDNIVLPAHQPYATFSGQLGIVIGSYIHHAHPESIPQGILGYLIANSIALDDPCITLANAYDTFCAISDFIENDVNPDQVIITGSINGQLKQSLNMNLANFSAYEIVEQCAKIMMLQPGDLILCGDMPVARRVNPEDGIEISISQIGSLMNMVVSFHPVERRETI